MAGIEDQLVEAFRAGLAAASALHTSEVMTKAEANYRPCEDGSNCCGDCACYSDGACSIVAGKVSESMTCDEFQPGSEGSSESDSNADGSNGQSATPKLESAVTGG